MEVKLTLCQRFQSLKNYIDTELRGIVAAFPGEAEYVANEPVSLASYIKDNHKYNDTSAVAQPALVTRRVSDAQGVYTRSVLAPIGDPRMRVSGYKAR